MQEHYNIKEKTMWNKYKDFKKGATFTLNYMEKVCDFFEKCKNLVKWEDPRMTFYFFLLLIVLFIVVTFLPLRFIIFMFLLYKCYRGQFYHYKRIRNNEEVCRIELRNMLDDNRMQYLITNYDEKWEVQLAKLKNIKDFEQKVYQHFQEALKIYLPKDIFRICETPKQLIEYVGLTRQILKL
jgi:hypothetical protein